MGHPARAILGAALLLLLLLSLRVAVAHPHQEAASETFRATVVRVIDGDTVVLDVELGLGVFLRGQRFRFLGVDAPEVRKPAPEEEIREGLRISSLLASRLPPGTRVTVTARDRDSFGRLLGGLWDSGGDVPAWVLEQILSGGT